MIGSPARPRIVRMSEMTERLGYSRPHVYRLIRNGVLPAPIPLRPGGRAVGWPEHVVVEIEAHRDAAAVAARAGLTVAAPRVVEIEPHRDAAAVGSRVAGRGR